MTQMNPALRDALVAIIVVMTIWLFVNFGFWLGAIVR
jgi:hypothetical protein